MAKKRHNRRSRKSSSGSQGSHHGHAHATDGNFIEDIDHTAYHLAESLRDLTNVWRKQGFTYVVPDSIPPFIRRQLTRPEDWERFRGYIEKWMIWWLRQDFSGPVIAGSVSAHVITDDDDEVVGVVFGYELQPSMN